MRDTGAVEVDAGAADSGDADVGEAEEEEPTGEAGAADVAEEGALEDGREDAREARGRTARAIGVDAFTTLSDTAAAFNRAGVEGAARVFTVREADTWGRRRNPCAEGSPNSPVRGISGKYTELTKRMGLPRSLSVPEEISSWPSITIKES